MGATLTLHVVNLLFDFFPSFSFLVILSNSFLFVFILFFILFHSFSFFFFHVSPSFSFVVHPHCIRLHCHHQHFPCCQNNHCATWWLGDFFFYFLNLFFNHCANWWLDGEDLVVPEYIYRSLSQSMIIWIYHDCHPTIVVVVNMTTITPIILSGLLGAERGGFGCPRIPLHLHPVDLSLCVLSR